MKLSENQLEILNLLSRRWKEHTAQHPKDAYNSRTINSLINKGLVEEYKFRNFLGEAIRLTDEGRQVLKEII